MTSIVIPVYNAEAYIAQTIESVIRQTDTDWELILVDDASTDGSVPLMREIIIPHYRHTDIYFGIAVYLLASVAAAMLLQWLTSKPKTKK